jgi:hypothetical protein
MKKRLIDLLLASIVLIGLTSVAHAHHNEPEHHNSSSIEGNCG